MHPVKNRPWKRLLSKFRRSLIRGALGLGGTLLALTVSGVSPVVADALGDEAPKEAEASTWLEWRQEILRGSDPGPRVKIDSNGQVSVRIPVFLRGAGDYVFELEIEELSELRRDLDRLRGLDLDAVQARKVNELRRLSAAGNIPTRVGSVVSRFEMDGGAGIEWRGLGFDADYVDDWRLALLADIERRCVDWTRDPRRRLTGAEKARVAE